MLNCCIERKKAREAAMHMDADNTDSASKSFRLQRLDSLTNQIARDRVDSSASERGDFSTSSDDEFFECADSQSQIAGSRSSVAGSLKDVAAVKHFGGHSERSGDGDQLDSRSSNSQSESVRVSDGHPSLRLLESESEMSFTDSFTHQPDGRSRILEDLKLLTVDEPLYIPLTQEPAPMTEDMLEEHAEVLAKWVLETSLLNFYVSCCLCCTLHFW